MWPIGDTPVARPPYHFFCYHAGADALATRARRRGIVKSSSADGSWPAGRPAFGGKTALAPMLDISHPFQKMASSAGERHRNTRRRIDFAVMGGRVAREGAGHQRGPEEAAAGYFIRRGHGGDAADGAAGLRAPRGALARRHYSASANAEWPSEMTH